MARLHAANDLHACHDVLVLQALRCRCISEG